MQIVVPIYLTIEVAGTDATAASPYLKILPDGTITSDVNPEFIADLFTYEAEDIAYSSDTVVKICGYTQEEIRQILNPQTP